MSEREEKQDWPAMEKACPDCEGRGGFPGAKPSDWRQCSECRGRGLVPTEFGEQLMMFADRYFGKYFVEKSYRD